jgi:hypothetical protein
MAIQGTTSEVTEKQALQHHVDPLRRQGDAAVPCATNWLRCVPASQPSGARQRGVGQVLVSKQAASHLVQHERDAHILWQRQRARAIHLIQDLQATTRAHVFLQPFGWKVTLLLPPGLTMSSHLLQSKPDKSQHDGLHGVVAVSAQAITPTAW